MTETLTFFIQQTSLRSRRFGDGVAQSGIGKESSGIVAQRKNRNNPHYGYPIILYYSYNVKTKGGFWQKRQIFVMESDRKEASVFVGYDKAEMAVCRRRFALPRRKMGENSTKKVKLAENYFKNTAEIYENDHE